MAVEKEKLQEESVIRRFYKIILSWDYSALLDEYKEQKEGTAESTLVKVKNRYTDVDDYIATYEPLIFEEAKSQIIKGKEEEEVTYCKLGVVKSWCEADDFHFIEFPCEINEGESISQNDLLLLSRDKLFLDRKILPTVYAFALVEHVRKYFGTRLVRVRLYLAGEFLKYNTDDVKSCPRLFNMRSHICETERQLYFMKQCSLSTIAREYLAIRTLGCLPYKDLILSAVGEDFGTEVDGWKIPTPLREYVENSFNQYQREAITAGLSSKAFVLIQGPPGTGKTQTILGILSTILHATPTRVHSKTYELRQGPQLPTEEKQRHWGVASPWLSNISPRDSLMPKDGDDGFYPTTGNELKPEAVTSSRKYRVRVLVCAPSNSALDEIVLRVLNGGVHDENDRVYCPKIVRIGLKAHHSIKAVSLDELMKQKRSSANKSSTNKQSTAGSNDDSIRAAILDEATIVFSTLSFSGSHVFSKLNRGFDVVIVDEAAQAVEPATLVPLANQCKKVFLVGDPAQLPATVISDIAKNHGYGTSLFKRLMEAGYPVKMLKTQYRMHPEMKQKRSSANKSSTNKQSTAGSNDDSIRAAILDEATIVFSTLSFSGSHVFSKLNRGFDVVIVDEAAQAVEPATLVPLANQCKKVFLVGDPAQLPATVISDIAKNHGYGTSLFERLMEAGYPVKMLKTQYRMHPEIRSFPSGEFYGDLLQDGDEVKSRTIRAWHDYRCFGPFCFFDIHEGKEAQPSGSGSWINIEEVDFVLFLYQKLISLYPALKSGNQVAIISPYSQQVKLFQKRFEEIFGMSAEKLVDICTVDGCQGREKDIAIFSCVRASKDKGIGFLEDKRRMNVGITRAKSAVLVVGSASTLRRSKRWNKLVESAEKRDCLFKVSQPYSSFFSDDSLASMQKKVAEPSQLIGPTDTVDNDVQPNTAATFDDQAQAEDNDDGDVDMNDAGFDED